MLLLCHAYKQICRKFYLFVLITNIIHPNYKYALLWFVRHNINLAIWEVCSVSFPTEWMHQQLAHDD